MKLIILTALTLSLLTPVFATAATAAPASAASASAPAATKKACVEQTDAKTKKTKEVCKTVKVHKKLEGTVVPDKKAK
ncbi:MAG: hypothetical protein ACOVLB_05380 [Candidatus Nanopelagicus sp.]